MLYSFQVPKPGFLFQSVYKIFAAVIAAIINSSCVNSTETNDSQVDYIYSLLETTDPDGSKYNIISNSGVRILNELKYKNDNGWYSTFNLQTALEEYKADGIKFSGDYSTPLNYFLNLGYEYENSISVYLGVGHKELPLAETITASTSLLHKLAFETAAIGMTIFAKTRLAFNTIIDLHFITAYKGDQLAGTDAEFKYALRGSNRFDFKSRSSHYGFICGFETSSYNVSGVSTARMSQAHGGFYYSFDF